MNDGTINVIEADLSRADHQVATIELLNGYASDPMGDGRPLSDAVRRELIPGLQRHPTTMVFLAYRGAITVGIAVCFRGFSTFAARPLINIHDLHVLPGYQRRGIGKALIGAVEHKAREEGCCKLSLEVQENNQRARRTYGAARFSQRELQPEAGPVLYLTKDS